MQVYTQRRDSNKQFAIAGKNLFFSAIYMRDYQSLNWFGIAGLKWKCRLAIYRYVYSDKPRMKAGGGLGGFFSAQEL